MDEESIVLATEENFNVDVQEVIKSEVNPEDIEQVVEVTESIDVAEVEDVEEINIEMEESIGWVGGDSAGHYSLYGRDDPNQHTIGAITGLREELDEIERFKTVYSDQTGVANYYKWDDGAYDEYGYFVSVVPDTSNIKICDGTNIFGVTVDASGFIGGQNKDVPRNSSYGLVATTGLVDVRCELGINVGDCVVSNARGVAQKAKSDYGYRVLAKEVKNGVEYVVIMLGVQADVTDAIGEDLKIVKNAVGVNEKNIVSAINVANQAYNKSLNAANSATVSEEAIKKALEAVLGVEKDMEDIYKDLSSTNVVVAQAKAVAESAATSAISMKEEAVNSANNAWKSVNDLTKTLEPITTWEDPETGASGVEYLTTYMNKGIATTAEVQEANLNTEKTMSAIQKSAKELSSLVTTIDKYSVGEYSQAYGLTLDQAKSILEIGMIYVPTKHQATEFHKESYSYGKGEKYEREFTPGYLYVWDYITESNIGWLTVGESPSVYFSAVEPSINNRLAYWYTDGNEITDVDGNADIYEPYTLYKWEEDHWLAVATLKGNVSNRSTSQIRQTVNEFAAEVVNARGDFANLGARITDTVAEVQSITAWTKDANGNQYNLATIKQTADDAGADIALVVQEKDGEKVVNAASIVSAVNQSGSSVVINADHIKFDGYVSFANKSDVNEVKDSAVYDTTVEYALSSSAYTFISLTDWAIDAPVWQDNAYMWQRTAITKGDGAVVYSKPTCIQGAKGSDGTGVAIKGTAYTKDIVGDDDIGNEYIIYKDVQCDTQIINAEDGDSYLVEGYLFVYSGSNDNFICAGKIQGPSGETPTISINNDGYWVINGVISATKAKGVDGKHAPTVEKVTKQYYLSSSNTTLVGGQWSTTPANFTKNSYMWIRDVYTMSDNTAVEGDPVVDNTFTTISGWCKENNQTLIDGGNIATNSIIADSINTSGLHAEYIDVKDASGNLLFKADTANNDVQIAATNITGTLTVKNGSNYTLLEAGNSTVKIGDFTVGRDASRSYLYTGKTIYNDDSSGVYLGTDGIGCGAGNFYVTSDGILTSTSGSIGGWNIDNSGISKNGAGMLSDGNLRFYAGPRTFTGHNHSPYLDADENDGVSFYEIDVGSEYIEADKITGITNVLIEEEDFNGDYIRLHEDDFEYAYNSQTKKLSIRLKGSYANRPILIWIYYDCLTVDSVDSSAFRVYNDGNFIATRGKISDWEILPTSKIPQTIVSLGSNSALYNDTGIALFYGASYAQKVFGESKAGYYKCNNYLCGSGIVIDIYYYGDDPDNLFEKPEHIGQKSVSWVNILAATIE